MSVETGATRCSCGYSFADVQVDSSVLVPEEQALQEEELLKEYLDARIGQAVSELEELQASLVHDPKNLEKANNLLKSFAQVRELRSQRETQLAKIAEVKKAARAARIERGIATNIDDEIASVMASTEPTEAFRTSQAAKAEAAMKAAGMNIKTCPKCRTVLPESAGLCFCGFAFTQTGNNSASQRPATTFSPGEIPKRDDRR